MNTFILNIPDSIKKVGEKINAKSSICDKAWEVYNEENVKVVFIFNHDGTLLISTNGDVENATWQYIKANRGIIIKSAEGSAMFLPTYFDDILLVLQKDGTENCLLLLNTDERVINKTLNAIKDYLAQKVQEYERSQRTRGDERFNRVREKAEWREQKKDEQEPYSWFNDKRV